MSTLVFNAGSSSLKFGHFDEDIRPIVSGVIDWGGQPGQAELTLTPVGAEPVVTHQSVPSVQAAVVWALEAMGASGSNGSNRSNGSRMEGITGVGQRVVHGGTTFSQSVLADASVMDEIRRLTELAPLHNPPALEAVDAISTALPGVPQVAVFDTAFYATLTPAHFVYPAPYAWYADWGVRRFGFHGISHAYCAGRAAEMLGRGGELRVITCHLGNGCSATASRGGIAVATTMGFTPMDGLMMGTRSGSLDPGILLYLQRHRGLTVDALDDLLNHKAGLQGVSGVSADYRRVEEAARDGNARAGLALEIFAVRVREAVGSLAVTLGGVDALVFTAGVGEHSATLRAAACAGTECLGLRIAPSKNAASALLDTDIAADDSAGRILVIHTREEWMIAREVKCVTESP